MGDPKKHRKKFTGPSHPWQKERIDDEKVLAKEFGTRNKKEIWKMSSFLDKYQYHAKRLVKETSKQAEKEKEQILKKLVSLNLLKPDSELGDVLNLTVRDILERRLQTQLVRKGLARSVKQARQFITHGHVTVGNKSITIPSYLVSAEEENKIIFNELSSLADPEHPERFVKQTPEDVEEEAKSKDKAKAKKKEEEPKAKKDDAKGKKEDKPKKKKEQAKGGKPEA